MSNKISNPLVTIITVTFNAEDFLESTIQSVINQNYKHVQYIVIDGQSTDNTVEIIRKYQDYISHWISEPDKGISDAWNKGVKLATGDIIGILNAGDYFSDKTYLDTVVNGLQTDKKVVCYGNTKMIDESGQIVTNIFGKFKPFNLYIGLGFGFYHPGCFATRLVYDEVGDFVLRYKLAMDSDWLFRCYRANVVFKKLDLSCIMLDGGVSRKFGFSAYGEYLQAMSNNNFSFGYVYLSMIVAGVRGLVKSLIVRGN
jgi:glycosyltransferase involved in cell wall biosynthesis